jgi:hypothetical protein
MIPLPIRFLAAALAAVSASRASSPESAATSAQINWLGASPAPILSGVSFGVPWQRGTIKASQAFSLKDAKGVELPLQTWPLAYWPDGSLKWLGVATVAGPENTGDITLNPVPSAQPLTGMQVAVTHSDTTYQVDTGRVKVRIPKHGLHLVDSIVVDGREVARNGQLTCILQDGPDDAAENQPARESFVSRVDQVTVEQSGPVRAVVKIEGMHLGMKSARAWLPFVVRLYFYAGQESVRLVHTIVFDGDESRDFIRGLGVTFAVPMREQVHNRHVRFSGEGEGLWAEPVQPMVGRGGRFAADPNSKVDAYQMQISGERVPNREQISVRGQALLADWAVWDDFKLIQPNADGFTVLKRTNPSSVWLPAGAGKRASGLVFVGDVSGGLALGVKNFWQSYPSSLEVRNASTGEARLTAWLWSPDAPSMDLRHYDTKAHGLESVYEDVQPGFSTAHGVARTSELTLFPTASVPGKEATVTMARLSAAQPVLVCTPKYLQSAQAFGIWSTVDRSTPTKTAIEDGLNRTLDFYLTQPEQQHWYGFWDFGDVMHSYDDTRHRWRYDLGGMAWANSELGPDMWLWYSFLRSGRAELFRMAEAMTRHTGEVDCYHLGRFAGLGSRHNVRHWGCGAKEARISQAAYRRFYYYLTTDERVGDVMHEMLNVDFKTIEFDPMRLAQPITEAEKKIAPTRVRLGPDWLAFVGNWMTEWERTGNTAWRDKILSGVACLDAMPKGLRSGKNLVFGYDPATGKLYQLNETAGIYNLATIMGGAEVVFELNMMLDDARWHRLWLQYCRLYSAPTDVLLRDRQTGTEGADASYIRDGRLAAYVYHETHNEAFLNASIKALLGKTRFAKMLPVTHVSGPDVLNPVDEGLGNTNSVSQDGLETISMLGFVGDKLPAELPPPSPDEIGPFDPRRGPPGIPRVPGNR